MILWNGSDVGEISSAYSQFLLTTPLKIKIGFEWMYVHRFKDQIPLIVDELKTIFGLSKVGRLKATMHGRPCILTRISGDERYLVYGEEAPLNDVMRCFIFRWALDLIHHGDHDMIVRREKNTAVVSYNEEILSHNTNIPVTVMTKWFGSHENLDKSIKMIIGSQSMPRLRGQIESVVKRVSPSHIWIVMKILTKLEPYLNSK